MINKNGFTIVELLVVIVVIGILAAITIVSYSGIYNKAIIAGLQSDLDNDAKMLKLYNVEYGYYPNALGANNCPAAPTADARYCLKFSSDTTFTYSGGGQSFTVVATKKSIKYQITESSSPMAFQILTGPEWMTIGSQSWAKANANIGTMIAGTTSQTNNSTLEKYCYSNLESNCTTYGGLYSWDEAMQYVTTEGAQGICPAGSHIPTDNDWKILEVSLGMTQVQADLTGARGTDQATQLKSGGSSGLKFYLAGQRAATTGLSANLNSTTQLWSSTESSTTTAWVRYMDSAATVGRYSAREKILYGFSVRCVSS